MPREKAECLNVEDEVFGRALDPDLRIALARQRVIRAIDFGDRELRRVVFQPIFRRFYAGGIEQTGVDQGFFRSRKLSPLRCRPFRLSPGSQLTMKRLASRNRGGSSSIRIKRLPSRKHDRRAVAASRRRPVGAAWNYARNQPLRTDQLSRRHPPSPHVLSVDMAVIRLSAFVKSTSIT
jgi:hypothetical protein